MIPASPAVEAQATAGSAVPASEGVQALLDASAMLLASVSVDEVVARIVDLARQIIKADAYAVWRTYDGRCWRVLAASGLSPDYRRELLAKEPIVPQFQAIPDVTRDDVVGRYEQIYKEEGIRSLLVVPLQLADPLPDGPNGGTITFYWRTQREPSHLDIFYASALANLSSAALRISELHEQNQREKARLAFLAEASELLASSLDYEITLERVARLAVPRVADWCTVQVVENGALTRVAVAHADPEMVELAHEYLARYPEKPREDRGLGRVLRTGEPEFVPAITEELLSEGIPDHEQRAMLQRLGLTASIVVPLKSRGKVLGAIRLLASGERRFREDDVRLGEDLARRAGAAIENAQLHRAVLEQENRFRLAHAAARMGAWSWDIVNGRMTWSDEFRELHGLSHNAASTEGAGPGLIYPDDRERVLREMQEAFDQGGEFVSVEHRAMRSDGTVFWVHSRGRIERDNDGRAIGVVGIAMDITERRQAEEALRKTEKLAAAGRLAATVAHEINNPLESIVNLVYLSRSADGLPEKVASYLKTVDEELMRIAQIVRQTLGFYRESVGPRKSDVGLIVGQTVEVYRSRIASRDVQCEMELENGLFAYVVPGELKQVVANLVSNA
ncbi:MAG TPA: GAF domain-containing protein, partial [Acidobacteriaceae bacterium]|nr:GAF domain-containing protein [Acidobacteriaceae bacterium]